MKEARDKAVDLTELNSKAVTNQYKKGPELQEFLNTYGMGFFNMVCNDIRKYR